ncbi:Zn-dependent protease with chaperone function [Kibdelosporangium banguiense]|uniref:Zn-dependent protease with chaperone function n=1 Tax=Kibdelosporangium banguiense TaxID=1365924 RepID=A0ABS4T616_9PSEU|nr:M48 family metallopeptidase [Kibdelosporangium banguiense]MBP2319731.1 Zn-dependent protease with chaperone function [Kibdelosporangium banguiense]
MAGRLLLIGYFVLPMVLVGLLLAALGIAVGPGWAVLAGIVVVLLLLARAVFTHRAKTEPPGTWINRKRHPQLWQVVEELATTADTRSPDEIRIGPDFSAVVQEQAKFRTLIIGLPMLGGLTVSELRAVVGHELAHFSTGHAQASSFERRATASAERSHGLLRAVFVPYAQLYLLVTRAQSRAREVDADAASVRAAGKDATRSALAKLLALSVIWARFRERSASQSYEYRTPDLVERFHRYLAGEEGRRQLATVSDRLLDKQPKPLFDTHPPTRVRLATLDTLAEDAPQPTDDRPAWDLLTDPKHTLTELQRQLYEELALSKPRDVDGDL